MTKKKAPMVGLSQRYQPKMPNAGNGIRHRGRERLLSVSADADGNNVYTRQMNPGVESTYSVGSIIARGFECWSIPADAVNSLEFVSSSPATARGRFIMCANYDSSDTRPLTEDDFADRNDAVACSIWENTKLILRGNEMVCPGAQKPVRVFDTIQDRLLTDGCTLHIGIFGADAGPAGSVYINYDCRLHVQRPFALEIPTPNHKAMLSGEAVTQLPPTDANLVGLTISYDGIGLVEEAGTFTIPRGYFELTYSFSLVSNATTPFFVSVGVLLNNNEIEQSRTTYSSSHASSEEFGLYHTGMIFHAPDGGLLNFNFNHDHSSVLSLVGERSRALLTRV